MTATATATAAAAPPPPPPPDEEGQQQQQQQQPAVMVRRQMTTSSDVSSRTSSNKPDNGTSSTSYRSRDLSTDDDDDDVDEEVFKEEEDATEGAGRKKKKKKSFLSSITNSALHKASTTSTSSHNNKSQGPAAVDKDGDPCTISLVLTLWGNIMFVIASCFYTALAVVGMQFEVQVKDYPEEVLNTEDDEAWEEMGFEDDFILHFGKDDNNPDDGIWVTRYTTFYFVAAFCFVMTGFLEYCQEPGPVAGLMVMAGAFGLASATVVEKDERLSDVLNAVSVHLFALEAVSIYFFRHWHNTGSVWLKYYVHFGDVCWIIGSLTDVVLAYIGLFGTYTYIHATIEVPAAALWLTCSVVYLTASIYQEYRIYMEYREMLKEQQAAKKKQLQLMEEAAVSSSTRSSPSSSTRNNSNHIPNRGASAAARSHQQQVGGGGIPIGESAHSHYSNATVYT